MTKTTAKKHLYGQTIHLDALLRSDINYPRMKKLNVVSAEIPVLDDKGN